MTGHTYLMKSRHGVYYLRLMLDGEGAARLGRRAGELRLSLRTKCKEQAKRRLLETRHAMSATRKPADILEPWEVALDDDRASYERGLALIATYGRVDADDVYRVQALQETFSQQEFRDYVHVLEYDARRLNARPAESESPPEPDRYLSPELERPTLLDRAKPTAHDETVLRALERFVGTKKRSARDATAGKYGAQCRLFLRVVSQDRADTKMSDLTVQQLRYYVDMLPKLPKKIMPDDRRTIEQLIDEAGSSPMAPKTVFAHAQAVNMFLKWANDQAYPVPSSVEGILSPLLKKPKSPKLEKDFTEEELRTIFSSSNYREGLFTRPSDYWMPLLGLFTGAREAELCQLHHSDIYCDAETNLWVIDFNAKADKRLKTESSARIVPIHAQLISLGLRDYLNTASTQSDAHVFPGESRNLRGEFGAFSKRFNRFKEGLGIRSEPNATRKDFHSFRHSLSSELVQMGIEEYVVNSITGHSQAGRSMSVSTYGGAGPSLRTKSEALARLQWSIDFKQIKPNGWIGGIR